MALKYEQIADYLREQITEGRFRPGDTLPSGRDLCEQFDVSRATVVKAMDVLRADGVVVARQGAGFTVVQMPVARPAGRRGSGSRTTGGAGPFRRLGKPTMEQPPQRIREELRLEDTDKALRRARLVLLEDGAPHTVVVAWFPPDIAASCPRLANAGPIAEGTTAYVKRVTGRAPSSGVDVYRVRLASAEEAELLEVARPAAVAVTMHTAVDANGPLVCEEGVTPADLWELTDRYPMGS
ncbi:GntR family transcriptional regulator [Streptomyces radicis]|uniref:GntR family transcriptional regulator n=1 Tax=Streptomyces radicis TaxID=1750517 RepID=A0A3A9W1R9_9ACTN|nr:GntR family transcriptional regulator [Streptomyces radicis]RKN03144.1 GntR family transcriptional regulator [Streptomyces radicis]RKN13061.1 GntR family transcriptional regulator [Streptomyces radicis]